jgi:DNA-binding NarL/FixJ family response regulator
MARVVALADDIFFIAKMKETAKQSGVELETVGTSSAFAAAAAADGISLLIVDLNAPESLQAVEKLRAAGNTLPLIAYLSHVQVDLAERARAAGCTEVLPRSRFTRELAEILSRARTIGG